MDSFLAGYQIEHILNQNGTWKKYCTMAIRPWLPRPLIFLEPKAQGVQILQRHTIPEGWCEPTKLAANMVNFMKPKMFWWLGKHSPHVSIHLWIRPPCNNHQYGSLNGLYFPLLRLLLGAVYSPQTTSYIAITLKRTRMSSYCLNIVGKRAMFIAIWEQIPNTLLNFCLNTLPVRDGMSPIVRTFQPQPIFQCQTSWEKMQYALLTIMYLCKFRLRCLGSIHGIFLLNSQLLPTEASVSLPTTSNNSHLPLPFL